ncbi:TVP38/TMEM64 family protein [Planococcus chinensis]|uniref:TVP38/TMEM64 family membrane protein n=1 Tax=Planococcus chinensis TaxID=272917 RepID=A0ABW4QKX8_9BACL
MENFLLDVEMFIISMGWLAPPLFILLHILRPVFFLPVIVVCIAGGVLFGFWQGALYNFIGLGSMNLIFYLIIRHMPKFEAKMNKLKNKLLPDRNLSIAQVMILRIMPFVHFHLLSFYLMEMTKNFKEYMYYALLGVLLPSILYTGFGDVITNLPWYLTLLMFAVLALLYSLLNKIHQVRLPFGEQNKHNHSP